MIIVTGKFINGKFNITYVTINPKLNYKKLIHSIKNKRLGFSGEVTANGY